MLCIPPYRTGSLSAIQRSSDKGSAVRDHLAASFRPAVADPGQQTRRHKIMHFRYLLAQHRFALDILAVINNLDEFESSIPRSSMCRVRLRIREVSVILRRTRQRRATSTSSALKICISASTEPDLVHSAVEKAVSVADSTQVDKLLHGAVPSAVPCTRRGARSKRLKPGRAPKLSIHSG